ncbi:glutamine amidotransferase [Cenarchaeum symbiosum A]|uniref:Imidazole glycerol phosphate synthase subunit HisH n=1 Tax=Cenarchaeum symbiosum (strain A) TaxID=414004 RepID=A0RZ76_CENSY|nr:glutamine amidotransferase [Cenarchaeum symbiosum A]
MVKVAILDYGAGNLFSLKNSLERAGAEVYIVDEPSGCAGYSGVLLPGVGNFDPAVKKIRGKNTIFEDDILGKIPVLGICLGMEMFFESSEEGIEQGLGAIPGKVVVLPSSMKVPHMGWNSLEQSRQGRLLEGVQDNSWAYFVHSYMVKPEDPGVVSASADYGTSIPAVIEKGCIYGTQFHPEKSGPAGRLMLENFLTECSR